MRQNSSCVHLRAHSYYSFLEGLPSPYQLAEIAAANNMYALGLTDRNGLSGAIMFYDACSKFDIKPILGLEFDIHTPVELGSGAPKLSRLVAIAKDLAGWGSLCRISSLLLSDPGNTDPYITLDNLSQNAAGLICLTGGKRGLAAHLLNSGEERVVLSWLGTLGDIFPDALYAELQVHDDQDRLWTGTLSRISSSLKIPVAGTHTIDYLHREDAGLQRVVSAIRAVKPVHSLQEGDTAFPDAYFLSAEELSLRFGEIPQAISSTIEIAERCNLLLPLGKPIFPAIDLPADSTAMEILRQKSESGAKRLYSTIIPEVRSRLEHELEVISECGYASLFLIVEDILGYARKEGVPISSRGSAASSLVAHCLGITSPDPLRLNLYFERFLNPVRASPPDIDTDLCSRRRDRVIAYVYERFGQDRVAMVATINTFQRRSALREVAKAFGLSPEEVGRLADSLPQRWYGPPDRGMAEEDPFAELNSQYADQTHQLIFTSAKALIGLPHHLSIHPGGVVIAPGEMHALAPTQVAAKGVRISQFDMQSIGRLGLVKIDLLGIRGLTVLGDVAEQHVGETGRRTIEWLEEIPMDDAKTAEMVRTGRTIGCFQIESPGMRATLKEVQASSVDDIMVALALYRPGPLTGGLKDAFVRRHRGEEQTTHLHPALAPLLEDTYGVILYQEQVLRIAHELAGLSLADSDLLRRAMSHFDPGKQMQTLQEKFISGASLHSGVPPAASQKIWELMAAFAGYGFPKAHAASYAQIAWRSAWCKLNYPAVFIAAVLANWGGYYSQRIYLTEARRMGLELRSPEVNFAGREFTVRYIDQKPVLFAGLDQVKDLTRRTIKAILEKRPFHSFDDFLARVDPRQGEAVNLVRCGALQEFGIIPTLLQRLSIGGWQGGQRSFLGVENPDHVGDWTINQKAAAQNELLGTSIIAHPLELIDPKDIPSGTMTTVDAAAQIGRHIKVIGMRQVWRRVSTIRGDYIYFMSLEDLEGMLEVVIRGEVYQRWRKEIEGTGPFLVEGPLEYNRERNEPFLRAERITRI